jgi:hypothetical protein
VQEKVFVKIDTGEKRKKFKYVLYKKSPNLTDEEINKIIDNLDMTSQYKIIVLHNSEEFLNTIILHERKYLKSSNFISSLIQHEIEIGVKILGDVSFDFSKTWLYYIDPISYFSDENNETIKRGKLAPSEKCVFSKTTHIMYYNEKGVNISEKFNNFLYIYEPS